MLDDREFQVYPDLKDTEVDQDVWVPLVRQVDQVTKVKLEQSDLTGP